MPKLWVCHGELSGKKSPFLLHWNLAHHAHLRTLLLWWVWCIIIGNLALGVLLFLFSINLTFYEGGTACFKVVGVVNWVFGIWSDNRIKRRDLVPTCTSGYNAIHKMKVYYVQINWGEERHKDLISWGRLIKKYPDNMNIIGPTLVTH